MRSDSEAVLVRTIPVGGASVLKMLSSDNGEYVYVMTQEKVRGCGLLSGRGLLGCIIIYNCIAYSIIVEKCRVIRR